MARGACTPKDEIPREFFNFEHFNQCKQLKIKKPLPMVGVKLAQIVCNSCRSVSQRGNLQPKNKGAIKQLLVLQCAKKRSKRNVL